MDGWAISAIAGARKPDPALFRAAANECRCTLDAAWMVGDRADADVAGAIAAGLRSGWISRGRTWQESSYYPEIRHG